MSLHAAGEYVALTWWPMPDDASAFKAADVFGRDNLHNLELRWLSIQLAANGKDPSKVLEEAKPRRVYRERLVVAHGPVDGVGNGFAPFAVQLLAIASEARIGNVAGLRPWITVCGHGKSDQSFGGWT